MTHILLRVLSCLALGHVRKLYSSPPTQLQKEHYEHHFGKPHWQGTRGWCAWCGSFTRDKPRFRKGPL